MSKHLVVFRADATSQIGTGHIVRCLTLAQIFQSRGSDIVFVSRGLPFYFTEVFRLQNIKYIALQSSREDKLESGLAHANWLHVSQQQDAREFLDSVHGFEIDLIVVDHYSLDYRWESAVKHASSTLFVIDDLEDRAHDCDFLLDQNLKKCDGLHYAELVPNTCNLLLGPDYCLLRKEFLNFRKTILPKSGIIKSVFVFFGGIDIDNHTATAIEALGALMVYDIRVDVVIGESHPAKQAILKSCEKYNFKCHVQTSLMADLMANSDLAIGSAGSVSWERCVLGLPCITYPVSANQVPIARALSSAGAIDFDEEHCTVTVENLKSRLITLFKSPMRCKAMSIAALSLVDGLGSRRICEALKLAK